MNFDFSDDQKMLREHAREFLGDQCDPTVPREILEGDEPYAKELWRRMVKLQWTGTAIPEEYGGAGYGYLELCVLAEEMGRVLAPVPFSSSVYLATEALLLAGSSEQKKDYLPKLSSGERIGTLAVAEGWGSELSATFSDGKLDGTKLPVPDGDVADFAVVLAQSDQGASLVLADLRSAEVACESVETLDPTRSHAKLTFTGAPARPLGEPGQGLALKSRLFDRAAVLMALEQVGGADICLSMATKFAKERYAFGRPIGSFQAVKHNLADMYIKNELARSNAYYGAWALSSQSGELPVAAAAARISGTQAYHYASRENIQIHGGVGFTWEYDCHLYYRRSKLLAVALGSLRHWKDRLIARLEAARAA